MAKWHLETAIEILDWLQRYDPEKTNKIMEVLEISNETLNHWRNVINKIIILEDPISGLFEQFEGFYQLNKITLSQYQDQFCSIQEILGIAETNKVQVLKQPDVIMLLCLFRDEFNDRAWKANWDFYNPLTDHEFGSSLGPSFTAWAACELEMPDIAYEHFLRAARCDLYNIRGNAEDGIHAASAGGLWQAIAFGFAGLELSGGKPTVSSRLPRHWTRISFKIHYRGEQYQVEVKQETASVSKISSC
jgi:kojibiose phosphorylase